MTGSRQRQSRMKQRRTGHLDMIPHEFYIFCEGKQTEPAYFGGFAREIERHPLYRKMVHIHVTGTGVNTVRVMYEAKKFVKENRLRNAQIWCVYDKDSFPSSDFNAVSEEAENLNLSQNNVTYHVAWSNQCVEYWFILHFAFYTADNDRKSYKKFLDEKFSQLHLGTYEKNNANIFHIMTQYGDPKNAIIRAERRLKDLAGYKDSDCSPATKIHLLVQELAKFLPDELRKKYI